MSTKKKIEKEIARKRKLIGDSENIMEQIPNHLRLNQELVLEIYKKELEELEKEIRKFDEIDFDN